MLSLCSDNTLKVVQNETHLSLIQTAVMFPFSLQFCLPLAPSERALVVEHSKELSLMDFLLEELYSFAGESWEQEDDITLLTLRSSATRS
jgi:hypothetical protein